MSTGYNDFSLVREGALSPEHTVVLVGAALDGPAQTPFALASGADPHKVLGKSPLADAYVAARQAGNDNIVAYRLNGVHATASLKSANNEEVLVFTSVSASSFYNGIEAVVYPTHLFVRNTDGRSRSYFFDKHPTARDLAYAINRDAYYGLLEFNARTVDEYRFLANLVELPSDVLFTGGSEEEHYLNYRDPMSLQARDAGTVVPLLKARLQTALFGEDAEDILERKPSSELGVLPYGAIVLCDLFHDDDAELTEMLGAFCRNKTQEMGFGSIGVIGVRPIYPEVVDEGESVDFRETVHGRVLELAALSQSLPDTEAYKYVQVVVGHAGYATSTESAVSVAYAYAAVQANALPQVMMSNKALPGFGKLNYEITKEDIALLTANGYICTVPSVRRGFVPFYAISYSKEKDSLLAKPHNLRISQHVSQLLVEHLDTLVGSNHNPLTLTDTIEAAQELLDELIADKVIRSYELRHALSERNTVLSVDVALMLFSEVRAVNSVAVIAFPKGVVA